MKKFAKLTSMICLLILISACSYKGYSGQHPELYTVAINSILWNSGHSYSADKVIDSKINIIERDQFGRTLFSYYEKYYSGAKLSFSALIISQGIEDGYVYYYEDNNYIIMQQEIFNPIITDFAYQSIEYLKSLNDWNEDVDYQKCIKKEITRKKTKIPCDISLIREKITQEFNLSNQQYTLFLDFLTSNDRNDILIYGLVIGREDIHFAGLVNLENDQIIETIIFIPNNLYDYRSDLVNVKNEHGWYV